MGRFIEIDKIEGGLDTSWIIPYQLVRYDRRYPPWPNDLFPFSVPTDSWNITPGDQIVIRRFCDRECNGDIVLQKQYSETKLLFLFWFDLENDKIAFESKFAGFVHKNEIT